MPNRVAALIAKMKKNGISTPGWMEDCQPIPRRVFRSRFPFWVWHEPLTGGYLQVGQTPGTLDIPESLIWWVEPDQSSDYDMLTISQEVQGQRVPGLSLRESSVGDLGLHELRELDHLRRLHLRGCDELTVDCLAGLGNKPLLHSLTIADSHWLTDEGLRLLPELPNLSELNLAGCFDLTSEGLCDLVRFPRLSTLFLTWTAEVVEGLAFLRRRVPNLQITASGSPEDIRRRYARI